VINRRNSRLDRDLRCLLRKGGKKKENKEEEKNEKYLTRSFHISVYQRFGKHYGVTADRPNATINSSCRGGHSDE
jgi:hypothetical protein